MPNYSEQFDQLSTREKYQAAQVKPQILGGKDDGFDIGVGVFGRRNEYLKEQYVARMEQRDASLEEQRSGYEQVMGSALELAQNAEDITQLKAIDMNYNMGLSMIQNGDPRGYTLMSQSASMINEHAKDQETQRMAREAALRTEQKSMSKQINVESDQLNEQFRKRMIPMREAAGSMSLIDELSTAKTPLAQKMIVTKVARLMQGSGVLSDSDIQAVSSATGTWIESLDQMISSGIEGAGMTPAARNGIIKALTPYAQKIESEAAQLLVEYDSVAEARGLDKTRVFAGFSESDFESHNFVLSELKTKEEEINELARLEEVTAEQSQSIVDKSGAILRGVMNPLVNDGKDLVGGVSAMDLFSSLPTPAAPMLKMYKDNARDNPEGALPQNDPLVVKASTRAARRRQYQNQRNKGQ